MEQPRTEFERISQDLAAFFGDATTGPQTQPLFNRLNELYPTTENQDHQQNESMVGAGAQDTHGGDAQDGQDNGDVAITIPQQPTTSTSNEPALTSNNNSNNNNNNSNNRPVQEQDAQLREAYENLGEVGLRTSVFVVLLLVIFVYTHWPKLLCLLTTFAASEWANGLVVRHVSGVRKPSAIQIVAMCGFLISSSIVSIALLSTPLSFWLDRFMLQPLEAPFTSFELSLFVSIVNDRLARSVIILGKMLLILLPGVDTKQKKTGHEVIEGVGSCWRQFLPLAIWYPFFVDEQTYPLVLMLFCGSMYASMKIVGLSKALHEVCTAILVAFSDEPPFGNRPTKEKLAATENLCAVCHDTLTQPICLTCEHVFCEACITQWLEQERTCPMCRAVIPKAGKRTRSGTTNPFWLGF